MYRQGTYFYRTRYFMKLRWVIDGFISRDLYAPFILKNDIDYKEDLRKKYNIILKQAKNAGSDETSLKIILKYKNKILESISSYYKADIAKGNAIILNLIKDIGNNPLAISALNDSQAFPGNKNNELQFFRCRLGNPANAYAVKDMIHLPKSMRSKSGNYRFSIPGNPSFYLSNSSYGCWIETGFPPENEFNVSPVLLDGTQKIFNLAVSIGDLSALNELEDERIHTWLKLLMLSIATSYRIEEEDRAFKSEYIISQAIMMACKKLKYDGIAYYSKRVSDEVFARCAINLALFIDYKGEYSNLIEHIKMDDSFNYSVYKQLKAPAKYKSYNLRSVEKEFIVNIGSYDRQYSYSETDFYGFDQFLFSSWNSKPNGKGKNKIPWGIDVNKKIK